MESNNKISYDINKSSDRIDEILNASNSNYSDKNYIPARSTLTYNNGYYVHVTALFIATHSDIKLRYIFANVGLKWSFVISEDPTMSINKAVTCT